MRQQNLSLCLAEHELSMKLVKETPMIVVERLISMLE